MATLSPDVAAALATLQSRWGAAAPRTAGRVPGDAGVGEVIGALATAPLPVELVEERPLPGPSPVGGVVSTGFPALDAILGPGGLPRTASVALRGTGSSGVTTVALRTVADAPVVDPAGPRRRGPADGGGGRPQPVRPAGAAGRASDPLCRR